MYQGRVSKMSFHSTDVARTNTQQQTNCSSWTTRCSCQYR